MKMNKRIWRKCMAAVLLIIAILGCKMILQPVQASAAESINIPNTSISYQFEGNVLTLWSANEEEMPDYSVVSSAPWGEKRNIEKVVIKSSIKRIGDWAFANCRDLKEVVIEDSSLTSIGSNAFYNCNNLIQINLPATVSEIGAYAFANCDKLTATEGTVFKLPDTLRELDDYTFFQCTALKNVVLPGQLSKIGESAFAYCNNLESINIEKTNVAEIEEYAFKETNLKEIQLPDSMVRIGAGSFVSCVNLREILISKNVVFIGENVFMNCRNLESIRFSHTQGDDTNLAWDVSAFPDSGITVYTFQNSAARRWFENNSKLQMGELHELSQNNSNYTVQMTESWIYTGKAICPKVKVTYVNGTVLRENIDYILNYSNNINVGTASVTIVGKRGFLGTWIKNFTITPKMDTGNSEKKPNVSLESNKNAESISKCKITVKTQTYTGRAIKPHITVKLGKKKLQENKDYVISSTQNNKKVGNKAKIVIQGIKKYKGKKTAKFTIIPATAKLKQKGNKLMVTNYYPGANLIMEISHNSKVIKGTVTAKSYKVKGAYSLNAAKRLYEGQKIKIRVKMSCGKKLQGKWSKWITIK